MFIDTLEFTIPIELCNVFSTLQKGPRSNLEFPASVNSYGTTQDANVQVVLRSNKVTFKVDGVSSNASMISKSECKTLKLSVFDVDRSLMPQEEDAYNSNSIDASPVQHESVNLPAKRHHDHEQSYPSAAKNSRTSYSESPRPRSPPHRRSQPRASPRPTENSQSKTQSDAHLNVKQEPEDPDLIEIEPDPEPEDIVLKREKDTPFMQIDYSSNIPHTQTSQAALDRLSFNQQSSHSQSPASSSSSFHQNVPHVPEYAEPGPSRHHQGDQSADDFLVFQDDNEGDENEADYSNDGMAGRVLLPRRFGIHGRERGTGSGHTVGPPTDSSRDMTWPCPQCSLVFMDSGEMLDHRETVHSAGLRPKSFVCQCGKVYRQKSALDHHLWICPYVSSSEVKDIK